MGDLFDLIQAAGRLIITLIFGWRMLLGLIGGSLAGGLIYFSFPDMWWNLPVAFLIVFLLGAIGFYWQSRAEKAPGRLLSDDFRPF